MFGLVPLLRAHHIAGNGSPAFVPPRIGAGVISSCCPVMDRLWRGPASGERGWPQFLRAATSHRPRAEKPKPSDVLHEHGNPRPGRHCSGRASSNRPLSDPSAPRGGPRTAAGGCVDSTLAAVLVLAVLGPVEHRHCTQGYPNSRFCASRERRSWGRPRSTMVALVRPRPCIPIRYSSIERGTNSLRHIY
jgi:hypothetical protein